MKKSKIFLVLLLFSLEWWLLTKLYHPEPSLDLISNQLNGASLFKFGTLLGGSQFSFLGHNLGVLNLNLVSLLFGLTYFLPFPFIYLPNLIFTSLATYFLIEKITQKNSHFYILTFLFSLTPFLWQSIFTSSSGPLLIFLFALLVTTTSFKLNFLFSLLSIFTSPLAWVFTPIILLVTKQKLTALIIFSLVISLIYSAKSEIFITWLSPLNPNTYRFQTDLHRQAENYSQASLLGKILYNKYISVPGELLKSTASYLDWDRFLFVDHSGKSLNRPLDKSQFFFLDLIFILYAISKLKAKRYEAIFVILLAASSAACLNLSSDAGLILWLALSVLVVVGYSESLKAHRSSSLFLFLFIFLGRIIYLNFALLDNLRFNQNVSLYQEVAQFIATQKAQNIYLTDRLGEPHLYLAYLKTISLLDLSNSLAPKLPKDKLGYYQPPTIDSYHFGSFSTNNLVDSIAKSTQAIFVDQHRLLPDHLPDQVIVNQPSSLQYRTPSGQNQMSDESLFMLKTK